MVRGDLLVPIHWATFDLSLHAWTEPAERAHRAAAAANVRVAFPRPGESVVPGEPLPSPWWPDVAWKTAQESPVVSSGLPPTPPSAPPGV
jgi:hypothetical protein